VEQVDEDESTDVASYYVHVLLNIFIFNIHVTVENNIRIQKHCDSNVYACDMYSNTDFS